MGQLQRLANGMRLYVEPMEDLQSMAIGVWACAGAIDEAPEENGIAHLLEHMVFKGTKRRSARNIAQEIESAGGYLNAATSYQRTGFYARVLKADAELAIDILADILTEPLFDQGEFAKEKQVVVQEIGEIWDAPDDAAMELLQSTMFNGQSLGRSILGSVKGVRSHDVRRLKAFMKRNYATDNLVVAAAGAVEPVLISNWLEERFPKSSKETIRTRETSSFISGCVHDERDIEQTHIALAFPAVGARHGDFYATRILAEVLGGGMASRLFQTIREERGLAYTVSAFADCYDETGVISVYAGTDASSANEVISLVRHEIESAACELAPLEIARARAMLKSSILMALESPMGRVEAAADQICTFGAPIESNVICKKLDEVSVDDVMRCAQRALNVAPPALAVVGQGNIAMLALAAGAAA